MLKKNDKAEVLIIDMNNLGYGVARIDGVVTFVDGAVKGERLIVKIIKVARDYMVARIEQKLTVSPERTDPVCGYFPRCGGCTFQHISYKFELEIKKNFIESELKKAKIDGVSVLPVLCSGSEFGYRNKIQCPVGSDFSIGFYSERSHEIVDVASCMLQNEKLNEVYAYIINEVKTQKIANLRHIYLRIGTKTGEIMVCFVCSTPFFTGETQLAEAIVAKFPAVVSVVLNHNPQEGNVILGDSCRTLLGKAEIDDIFCNLRFTLHPLSFFQVNHAAAEILYDIVAKYAEATASDTILDLYCGIGSIGLHVLNKSGAARLIGVEIVPEAVENARHNAKQNGISNCEFICSPAHLSEIPAADIVIIDPPRKGCDEKLIENLAKISPKTIVYVSCNPSTLARDIARFSAHGYNPSPIQPVDLFPRTSHVECVVRLAKK